MSAGIKEYDKMYTRKDVGPSWHGKDELVENLQFDESPADFNVIECPVEFSSKPIDYIEMARKLEEGKFRQTKKDDMPALLENIMGQRGRDEESKVLVNERTGRGIVTVSASYKLQQNREIFDYVTSGLEGIPYKINSIMTLNNQKIVVVAFDISQHGNVAGDEFRDNLTLTHCFDSTMPMFCLFDSSTRVVCQNTLNLAYAENHGIEIKIRGTKNADKRLNDISEKLDIILARRKEFYANLNRIASIEIEPEVASRALFGLFAANSLSTRAVNTTNNIISLYTGTSKLGIQIDGSTRYGLFNAVTQYYTRYSSDISDGMSDNATAKQWSQSEYGTGAHCKAEAYEMLINDDKLNALAEKGQKLYEEYEKDHLVEAVTV